MRDWRSTGLADEWVHLWVPAAGRAASVDDPRRLYTVCAVDPVVLELSLHSAGPAAAWARRAVVGDRVLVSQPTGRHRPPRTTRREVVVADHTGLPAARRIVATAPPGRALLVLLETDDATVPVPVGRPGIDVRVTCRPELQQASGLAAVVTEALDHGPAVDYLWLGAEAAVARAVRRTLRGRGWTADRYAVSGYWQRRDPGYPQRYRTVAARVEALYGEVQRGSRDPEAVADDLDDLLDAHDL